MVMKGQRLIIFGCGYVGRALARKAIASGAEVWVMSRNPDSLASVEEVPESRRIGGLLHTEDWHPALPGDWDLAVNLVSSAGNGLEGYQLSYIEGNRSIRRWAAGRRVGRFLYSSATSVYPQADGCWVAEDDVPDLEALSDSGRLLRQSEIETLEAEVFSSALVARLGGIYGPGRHLYLNRILEGAETLPGDGSGWLNLIHLEDIVSAIVCMLEADDAPERGVFNVVDDSPTQKQAIVDWLAARLGKPAPRFDPGQGGKRAARRVTAHGLPNRRVSNRRLREVFGWEPRFPDFKAGYAQILSKE